MIPRLLPVAVVLALSASLAAQPAVFVDGGLAVDVETRGGEWTTQDGALVGRGAVVLTRDVGAGDARVVATLRWTGGVVVGVGAGLVEIRGAAVVLRGAPFDGVVADDLPEPPGLDADVTLEIARDGPVLVVSLGDAVVALSAALPDGPLGAVALAALPDRPLAVVDLAGSGDLVEPLPRTVLWTNDDATEHRNPGLLTTPRGTLVATCEVDDGERVTIAQRRSTDGGRTWGPSRVIVTDPYASCANPCAVASRVTDVLWLLTTRDDGESHRVVARYSADDAETWSEPIDITAAARRDGWSLSAPVTGAAVEVSRAVEGRLVVPAQHVVDGALATHVLISDDFGETWELGGVGPPTEDDACAVLELDDGRLMLVTRRDDSLLLATSDDDGRSWSEPEVRPAVSPDTTRFSLVRHSFGDDGRPGTVVVASLAHADPQSSLGLFTTPDEGITRSKRLTLHAGPAGASSLAVLPDGSVACAFEAGVLAARETITFMRVTVDQIEG